MKLLRVLFISLSASIVVSCSTEDDNIDLPTRMQATVQSQEQPVNTNESDGTITVSPYFSEQLLFISHRGLTDYPENTFAAVNAAVIAGFKAVECDICMTRDSVFVLQHDPTIDRCSNGSGRVNDKTYEELLAYDFGSWKGSAFAGERIVRLDELLDFFKEKGLVIELDLADETRFKREWIPALYRLVKSKGMLGQTMFTATQDEFADFLSEPREIIISVSGISRLDYAQRALPLKNKVTLCNFSVPQTHLTPPISDYAHSNGVKIKTWTTTTKEEIDRCLDLGADYIITEVPLDEATTTNIHQICV